MKRFLCLAGACALMSSSLNAQIFNKNYVIKRSYGDQATVKATMQVNEKEIITVGWVPEREYLPEETRPIPYTNDAIVTKTDINGNVIWSHRYGYPGLEDRAHGLELTYDGRHVIIVGQAQAYGISSEPPQGAYNMDVLAFKVEIATGNLVWANTYGEHDGTENGLMIEKVWDYSSPMTEKVPMLYTIVGTASAPESKDPFQRLYAVSIIDNGLKVWSKRYQAGDSGLPILYNSPFTHTRTDKRNMMIAGTRWEINRPSHIFTMGIDHFSGNITDGFYHYNVSNGYSNGGGIERIYGFDEGKYALTFTTTATGIDKSPWLERVTVMKLNKDRKPLWTNLYWQEKNTRNTGLSIYPARTAFEPVNPYLDVYMGLQKDLEANPGFMRLYPNGDVNYMFKYNQTGVVNSNHYSTAMVRGYKGYIQKSIYQIGQFYPTRGFSLAATDLNGKTWCTEEEKIIRKEVKTEVMKELYKPVDYGRQTYRRMKVHKAIPHVTPCFLRNAEASAPEQPEETLFGEINGNLYPNPIASDAVEFNLKLNSTVQQVVNVRVFNSLGQLVTDKKVLADEGDNYLTLDATRLSKGVNLVSVYVGTQKLQSFKLIQQ